MLDEKDLQAIAQLMAGMENRMDQKLAQQKQEIMGELDARFAQQKQEIISETGTIMDTKIQESESRMMAYFEAAIVPKFDLLADGIKAINEKMIPAEAIDEIEDRLDALEATVRLHSKEIAKLKKAQ